LQIINVKIVSIVIFSILLLTTSAFLSNYAKGQATAAKKPFLSEQPIQKKQNIISKMSGLPSLLLAQKNGLNEIQGKKIIGFRTNVTTIAASKNITQFTKENATALAGENETAFATRITDKAIDSNPVFNENEPSIAAHPTKTDLVLAVSHRYDTGVVSCVVYRSTNTGATWRGPISLPLLHPGNQCSDPVIRWAPEDGSSPHDPNSSIRAYAVYMSIGGDGDTSDIVVSHSDDNGLTWSSPVVAIAGNTDGSIFPDKPWVATNYNFPSSDRSKNDRVFVTSTIFHSTGQCDIVFSRSLDGAESFPNRNSPSILSTSATCDPVLQGSRPAGGNLNDVLVCWFNSGTDGFLTGKFDERCRTSTNNGAAFGPEVTAVDGRSFELPYSKCPSSQYDRWWGGMYPSIEITRDGVAHMVYAADPTPGDADGECGDIFYARSTIAPYDIWTPLALQPRLNDDHTVSAQGFPTITSKMVTGGSILVAAWYDGRNSVPSGTPNLVYDTYTATNDPSWNGKPNQRISDVSSLSDFFIGDYFDASASRVFDSLLAHIIWTDRSDKADVFDSEDDVATDILRLTSPPQ